MIKNIGIFGVGGVGGFFGGKLCQVQDSHVEISFIARGEHLAQIKKNGLLLKTETDGEFSCIPNLATDAIDDLPNLDVCILCVKGFDLIPLLTKLKGRISKDTLVLPLLNGANIHDQIRSVIDTGIVFPACVYVGTHIEAPGVINQKGGACKILFGPDPKHPEFVPTELLELLQKASIKHEWSSTIQRSIWEKFTFIASFGLTTAANDKTTGEILQSESLRNEFSNIVHEIEAIAKAAKIDLPGNMTHVVMEKAETFPFETKTSFQRDFENRQKPDEREVFAGAILSYAKKFKTEAPQTQATLEKLERIKPSA